MIRALKASLHQKSDMVAAQFQWHVGPEGIVAKPEQFEELGIPVYTAPADCIGKVNSGKGDGVRHTVFTMDLIYQKSGSWRRFSMCRIAARR